MASGGEKRAVRTVCQECGNSCGMTVHVEDGRAVRVEAAPDSRGASARFCARATAGLERLYSPYRLLYPQKRAGREGRGRVAAHLLGRSARHGGGEVRGRQAGARRRVGVARQGHLLPAGGLCVPPGQRVRHAQRDQHRQHLLRAQRRRPADHLRLRRHARRRRAARSACCCGATVPTRRCSRAPRSSWSTC